VCSKIKIILFLNLDAWSHRLHKCNSPAGSGELTPSVMTAVAIARAMYISHPQAAAPHLLSFLFSLTLPMTSNELGVLSPRPHAGITFCRFGDLNRNRTPIIFKANSYKVKKLLEFYLDILNRCR
jgi:hypothetical protein